MIFRPVPALAVPAWRQPILALLLLVSAAVSGALVAPAAHSNGPPDDPNLRPVIGVFSQETDTVSSSSTIDPEVRAELESYRYLIPASYVGWIGQAGGRVLPILLDQSDAYYREIFERTNGILFPGGNQGIEPHDIYTEEGELLFRLAVQANDAGDHYPLWGTCLGFEELFVLLTGNGDVISQDVMATNLALSLRLTPGARNSRLFRSFPADLVRALRTRDITFNSHDHGLLVSEYLSNREIRSFFRMLSYNRAPSGPLFVSTVEARDYPFYGTQWHPEKNNFEWSQNADYSNMPHSPKAIEASQATAGFFLSEARKSSHVFPEEARDSLIYSAKLLYTGKGDWFYEQVYVFCPKDRAECVPAR